MGRVIADGLSTKGKEDDGIFHEGNFDPDSKQTIQGGLTENRPSNPQTYETYFDSSLDKPIWFNGTDWVDATGTVV